VLGAREPRELARGVVAPPGRNGEKLFIRDRHARARVELQRLLAAARTQADVAIRGPLRTAPIVAEGELRHVSFQLNCTGTQMICLGSSRRKASRLEFDASARESTTHRVPAAAARRRVENAPDSAGCWLSALRPVADRA